LRAVDYLASIPVIKLFNVDLEALLFSVPERWRMLSKIVRSMHVKAKQQYPLCTKYLVSNFHRHQPAIATTGELGDESLSIRQVMAAEPPAFKTGSRFVHPPPLFIMGYQCISPLSLIQSDIGNSHDTANPAI
jgi:hypothetical protein